MSSVSSLLYPHFSVSSGRINMVADACSCLVDQGPSPALQEVTVEVVGGINTFAIISKFRHRTGQSDRFRFCHSARRRTEANLGGLLMLGPNFALSIFNIYRSAWQSKATKLRLSSSWRSSIHVRRCSRQTPFERLTKKRVRTRVLRMSLSMGRGKRPAETETHQLRREISAAKFRNSTAALWNFWGKIKYPVYRLYGRFFSRLGKNLVMNTI